MNRYSDNVLFEVELQDSKGDKSIYSAGPRTFDLIEKINVIADKWEKIEKEKPHNMNKVNSNYETFSVIFNTSVEDAKRFSNEMIMKVIGDYVENSTKNLLAQGEQSK